MSGRRRNRRGGKRIARRAGGRGGRRIGRVDRMLPGDKSAGLMSIQSQGKPFPDRWIADFRWSYRLSVTDPDTFSDRVFSGNSCFDPGISFSSTQPTNFDQFAILYQKYRVIKSRIIVEPLGEGTAVLSTGPAVRDLQVCVVAGNVSTAFSNMSDAMAAPYSKEKVSSTATPKKITNMMHSARINGLTSVEIDPGQSALVTASPSDEWFWHVCVQEPTTQTDKDVTLQITIIYTTEFFDRLNQPLSTLAARAIAQETDWKQYMELKNSWECKTLPGRLPKPDDRERLRMFVEAVKESKEEADEDKWLKLRKLDNELRGLPVRSSGVVSRTQERPELKVVTSTPTTSRSSSAK